MCGRFCLFRIGMLEKRFGARLVGSVTENYNIAPTQEVPIIESEDPSKFVKAKFGYIPSWSKDGKVNYSMINARIDGIEKKPAYSKAFRTQHCLIPADGFYEWKQEKTGKQPYYVKMKDNKLFAMAGLYNVWNGQHSFTIITTKPTTQLAKIHDRMPVVLPKEKEKEWLDIGLSEETMKKMLKPAQGLETVKVGKEVGSVKNNSAKLIREI